MQRVRTTVAVPADLLTAVDAAVKKGKARSRNAFLEEALRNHLAASKREEIDAAFSQMASDPDYQQESLEITEEFAASDWEALRATEGER